MPKAPPRIANTVSISETAPAHLTRRLPSGRHTHTSHFKENSPAGSAAEFAKLAFSAGLGDDAGALVQSVNASSYVKGQTPLPQAKRRWAIRAQAWKAFAVMLSAALVVAGCVLLYAARGSAHRTSFESSETNEESFESSSSSSHQRSLSDLAQSDAKCVVYVSGAVHNPGVVELPANARISDAVEAVGGLTQNAQEAAINLAAPISDGQHIHIFAKDEERTRVAGEGAEGGNSGNDNSFSAGGAEGGGGSSSGISGTQTIDLNTATRAMLETIPGVGPVMAQRIIDWRSNNGGFNNVEQLREVDGIGEKVFTKLKDYVRV